MFFTKLANVVARLALVLGMLITAVGLLTAMLPNEPGLARFSSAKSIDDGIYALLFAMALGTLAEISFSMRKQSGISN
jgi:hypothetical protein